MRRKNFITAAALFFVFFMLLFQKEYCYAEDNNLLTENTALSIWQEKNAKTEAEVYNRNETETLVLNGKKTDSDYEYLSMDLIFDKIISLDKQKALAFYFRYNGNQSIWITFQINDTEGNKLEMADSKAYVFISGDKKYIRKPKDSLIEISPDTEGEIVIYLDETKEKANFYSENVYGITLPILMKKGIDASFSLEKIEALSPEKAPNIEGSENAEISGSDNISIPGLGVYWYDFTLNNMGNNSFSFIPADYGAGCTLSEEGRLTVEAGGNDASITIQAENANGYIIAKNINILKPIDKGYTYSKPDEIQRVRYPLQFLSHVKIISICRMVVIMAVIMLLITYIGTYIVIWRKHKQMEKEEF